MKTTNFLEDMTVEVNEHRFANGATGMIVTYKMEERERVKIVDYQGGDGKSIDRKSTRLNSSHSQSSYAVFCLKKKIRMLFRNMPMSCLPPFFMISQF